MKRIAASRGGSVIGASSAGEGSGRTWWSPTMLAPRPARGKSARGRGFPFPRRGLNVWHAHRRPIPLSSRPPERMDRRPKLPTPARLAALCLLAAALPAAPVRAQEPARPNVVVILADDMGYSDIGPYGSEIRTPSLDALAARGIRFQQFYNNAKCSPTRASLLTGIFPHRVGMGDLPAAAPGRPGAYQGFLPGNARTLAEALRGAGYRTYMSGKWHLGEVPELWPRTRGFDRYFGLISGASSYFQLDAGVGPSGGRRMVLEDAAWTPPADGFYATDAFTDYAVDRVVEHRRTDPDRPFFLYLAYTAPHWPLHALPQDVARYAGRYDAGWDSVRAERYERMKRLGLIDERHPFPERPRGVPAWSDVPAAEREDWARRMEVYAAMIDRMDQGIGRVLDALDRTGARENTLVIFVSDNGASAENVSGRNLHQPGSVIGSRASYLSYLEPWANVSNTPYRLYKNFLHEGGIKTHMIASWPRGISPTGTITPEVGHVVDIMPTVLDLAGVTHPAAAGDGSLLTMDGRSLAATFSGGRAPRAEPLYWSYGGHFAIREGDWKLAYDSRSKHIELFDLAADPTERTDLSARHPARVAGLRAKWQAWAERVGAREAAAIAALP